MGSPPPPDAPSPAQQDVVTADAGFAAGPPVASLCGFAIPSFMFKFGLNLKLPGFPPPLPKFSLALGLNCDVNNPINLSGGVAFGGGRKAMFDTAAPDTE